MVSAFIGREKESWAFSKTMPAFDLSAVSLGDVSTSGKGAKSCPFVGPSLLATFQGRVAFEPSAFGDTESTRVNLVIRPSDEDVQALQQLDAWVLSTVQRDPVKYFGKQRSVEQIAESYTPSIKHHEKYGAALKGKMNLEGVSAVKVWDSNNKLRPCPAEWRDCLVNVRLKLRSLWFMGQGGFGVTLEVSDVQILEENSAECPF
jgi:hypothetical protein